MQIQVNSDNRLAIDDELSVQANVNGSLRRFGDQITRVEVHLSDVNGQKSGAQDKHCLMEARPAGRDPVVVTNQAATLEGAARGAARKMQRLLSSLFGRRGEKA